MGAGPRHRRMQTGRALSLILVAGMLASCGSGATAGVDGREFLSTSVTEDGAPMALVPGTRVRLSFGDGQLGASAGCNSIGGGFRIEGGVLVFDGGGMTEMGCDPDRHAQDEWLVAFLASRPTVELEGADLVLTSGGTIIALVDREVAEPDLPLTGTTWTVDTIISGHSASTVPVGGVATLHFADDGRVEVGTGCNTGSGRYETTGDELRFTDVVVTERVCAGEASALEAAVLPIIGAESVTYAIDASRLTLQAGNDGLGLVGS
jgi:heat shock protein HslJ